MTGMRRAGVKFKDADLIGIPFTGSQSDPKKRLADGKLENQESVDPERW